MNQLLRAPGDGGAGPQRELRDVRSVLSAELKWVKEAQKLWVDSRPPQPPLSNVGMSGILPVSLGEFQPPDPELVARQKVLGQFSFLKHSKAWSQCHYDMFDEYTRFIEDLSRHFKSHVPLNPVQLERFEALLRKPSIWPNDCRNGASRRDYRRRERTLKRLAHAIEVFAE